MADRLPAGPARAVSLITLVVPAMSPELHRMQEVTESEGDEPHESFRRRDLWSAPAGRTL